MDLFKNVLTAVDAAKTQLTAKARAMALNITELELKVQEATNADNWGPHGSVMGEIAQAAEDPTNFNQIMGVIEQRLQENGENWKLCYKALLLLEFLCRRGPLRCAEYLKGNITALEALRDDFQYKDGNGKDQGINVRQRARELVALITNKEKLMEEREKAVKNIGKYSGMSSADVRSGMAGSGSGGNLSGLSGSGNNLAGMVPTSASSSPLQPTQPQGSTPEDPFEATRMRIQQLKFEGAIPDGPLQVNKPDEPGKKTVKKLSEVKVDPTIAAKLNVPLPASGNGFAAAASPAPPPKPAASPLDMFAELDSGPVSTSPAPAAHAADVDDWSGFAAAGVAAPAKKLTDIEAMLNLSAPAASGNAPLPMEAFSAFGAPFMAPAPPAIPAAGFGGIGGVLGTGQAMPQAVFDPFGAGAAVSSADPFTASSAAPPMPAPTGVRVDPSKPKLGVQPAAKKNDPFSDLLTL